uniref:Uncharacterized protein n=1 Tax=Suricata suricatta TaxID=37032 RepID=A0A673T8I9_SURSU
NNNDLRFGAGTKLTVKPCE